MTGYPARAPDEEPPPGDALRPGDYVEWLLGLVFAAFLIVAWASQVGFQLLWWKTRHTERLVAAWVGWAVVFVLMCLSVRFVGTAIERAWRPLGVSIALQQHRWPLHVAPLAAAWWIANATAMVVAAHWVVRQYADFGPSSHAQAMRYACTVAVMFSSTFAANTYGLLAVSALTRSPAVLRFVWRMRIVIDLATAFLVPTLELKW